MFGSRAERSLWPLTVFATLGLALSVQACSGRVEQDAGCRTNSSCGGVGAAGGKAEAGSAAVANGGAGSGSSEACENGRRDSDESDVDCGGSSCARCAVRSSCTTNDDCDSAFCKNNHCAQATCADRLKNQDESGVDCGGSCPPCDIGSACLVNDDCATHSCENRVCADHCLSGVREADETDVDCGGSACEACPDDSRCLSASDCQSLVCSDHSCRPATCSDLVKNQDESDKDCGGVCSDSNPCPPSARCDTQADCESWICSAAGKCVADIVISPDAVIDDFEDGDLSLPARAGRVGNWYLFGDGTGIASLDSLAIKRGAASVKGLHTRGKDFKSWGSGLGVDLNNSGASQSSKAPYDATAFAGITFWARAESEVAVTVSLPDADTDAAGKTCTACEHHYYQAVQVTPTWQRFTIAFSALAREPGGAPAPTAFKPSGVFSILFRLVGQNYDLYVDDIAFVTN